MGDVYGGMLLFLFIVNSLFSSIPNRLPSHLLPKQPHQHPEKSWMLLLAEELFLTIVPRTELGLHSYLGRAKTTVAMQLSLGLKLDSIHDYSFQVSKS